MSIRVQPSSWASRNVVVRTIVPTNPPASAPTITGVSFRAATITSGSLAEMHTRAKAPSSIPTTAWQMLIGGASMVAVGLAVGEANELHVAEIGLDSAAAFVFLISSFGVHQLTGQ